MSNPFLKEARSTVNSKLHKMGGSGPDQYARAEKLAHAKYADGGKVTKPSPPPYRPPARPLPLPGPEESQADRDYQAIKDRNMKRGGCT